MALIALPQRCPPPGVQRLPLGSKPTLAPLDGNLRPVIVIKARAGAAYAALKSGTQDILGIGPAIL